MSKKKLTSDVFGVSNLILVDSYVDRGNLDDDLKRYLNRKTHIALRGESKCGKSWLRQKNIPNALVVQCRFKKTVTDIYIDALSQLGIKLTVEKTSSEYIKGHIEAQSSFGTKLLIQLGLIAQIEGDIEDGIKEKYVGRDINDLRYIADIIIASGKRLVIEDFHYLSTDDRKYFAYDLKTLWDYGCFVVIIGVWTQSNLLTFLNPDLSGRIQEMSIYWSKDDLNAVINNGGDALNIKFSTELREQFISNCFENVGILQKLLLLTLDVAKIYNEQNKEVELNDLSLFEKAAKEYATQLDGLYQQFAKQVSTGIRKRKDSTGIYAHAMKVIVDADDIKLLSGLKLNEIFEIANTRQPRIQKGNLRTVLQKLEELQVDKDGRGLVIAFDESCDEITAVDRQLLFYRKFSTVRWPWEDLIEEAKEQ